MTDQEIEASVLETDWDAFVGWIKEDMELPKLPIEWSRCETPDIKIIRIDLCKDKLYHVTTAIEDRPELCTHDVAYALAGGLLHVLSKAIENNSPYTYFRHFDVRAVV